MDSPETRLRYKIRVMRLKEHLYLTGYRGTGKSAVGIALARRLDRPIIDLDQVVEANSGKSIRQLFDSGGEILFRKLESEALSTVSEADPSIISLGGGAILAGENREIIKRTGVCVWLTATAETIAKRINADSGTEENRPALTDLDQLAEIRQLLKARDNFYADVADHRIDTEGRSIDSIADLICSVV